MRNYGFTLVELLIVISVLGVISSAILVVVNPLEQMNKARTAKAKAFHASIAKSRGFDTVALYRFETTSSTIKDESSFGNNDLTVVGATIPSDCELGFGSCRSFDGVNDYANKSSATGLSRTQLTFMFWSKQPVTKTTYMHPMGFLGGHNATVFVDPTRFDYWYKFDNINGITYSRKIATADDKWHHFTVTYNGSTIKGYMDGDLKVTESAPGVINGGDESIFVGTTGTGNSPSANYFQGYIDEVYIFNQTLSDARIEQIYAKGLIRQLLSKR